MSVKYGVDYSSCDIKKSDMAGAEKCAGDRATATPDGQCPICRHTFCVCNVIDGNTDQKTKTH